MDIENAISTLNEEIELNEEMKLNEGVKFFKASKRLRGYAKKLENQTSSHKKTELSEFSISQKVVQEFKDLADKYEEVEKDYASKKITKEEASEKLKKITKDNKPFMKRMNSASISKAMKVLRVGSLLFVMLKYLNWISSAF